MRFWFRLAVALIAGLSPPALSLAEACVPDDLSTLLMLDASYSMLRTVSRTNGATRFAVARGVIGGIVDNYPPGGYLALRLYGSQSTVTRRDCQDTNLAVPFALASRNGVTIKATLAQTHARGMTPVALALQDAIGDFANQSRERLIVIVTDGGESCGGDPCAMALDMSHQGFVIDTVGFLLNDADSRQQLQCIARVTHGSYADAQSSPDLADKLGKLLAACAVAFVPRRYDFDRVEFGALVG